MTDCSSSTNSKVKTPVISKEDTIWADGCFDICHFGHANSLRQAKQMGKKLIVGVHSTEDITRNKGPPVFTDTERYEMVRSIKWVDEVVEASPYLPSADTLDKYGCGFCAHGDDLSIDADGLDAYRLLKQSGRYKEFKRTQGVSTTDIVGRMLMATKNVNKDETGDQNNKLTQDFAKDKTKKSPWTGVSKFLQTNQKIAQFSDGKEATADDIVVYVAGAFDVFHTGHLRFLMECAKLGTYLVVGLHTDEEVNRYRGDIGRIMNLNERTLSLLACRYVSEVVIGAPYKINKEMIEHFNIKHVCHGNAPKPLPCADGSDPYSLPKEMDIFRMIDSKCDITFQVIVNRIVQNRMAFEERNRKKQGKESEAFESWTKGREEHGATFTAADSKK